MPAFPPLAALADDFTGAAEVAARLHGAGVPARVAWQVNGAGDGQFLVLDSATRSLPEDLALRRLEEHLAALNAAGRRLAYKKIDSTLRGHLGAELAACLRARPGVRALVCPAFPDRGRTVVGGILHVDGVPLPETAFARDPRHPMDTGEIATLLARQGCPGAAMLDLNAVRAGAEAVAAALAALPAGAVAVADAETDADLQVLARACGRLGQQVLPVGASGLLAHLPAAALGAPPRRPVLVVVGSLHPASRAQADALAAAGAALLAVDPAETKAAARAALAALEGGRDTVLISPDDRKAAGVLSALATATQEVLAAGAPAGLVLAGGETARSVLELLRAAAVQAEGELEAGVAAGRVVGGAAAGLPVVSKAGGFGDAALLQRCAEHVRRAAGPAPRLEVLPSGQRPRVAVTVGDMAGVGPEVALKAVLRPEVRAVCRPVLVADLPALQEWVRRLGLPLELAAVARAGAEAPPGAVPVLHVEQPGVRGLPHGRLHPAAGAAAVAFIRAAVAAALAGEVVGLATGPLNKEAVQKAGFTDFPGHTELLQQLTGAPAVSMMLVSGHLRVAHVSTHVSLRTATERAKTPRILTVTRLLHQAVQQLGVERPRLAVAGLNPHAGEHRLFGDEDADQIEPAVAAARAEGLDVHGPVPPDTVYLQAVRGAYDGVVAMYHDQGHIPVKLVGFESAVNVTLGLPIIRTSVDHGTAFDIAGRGLADPSSMVEALKLAAALARSR